MIKKINRRSFLNTSLKTGVALSAMPYFFTKDVWAQDFANNPGDSDFVQLGFNIPKTGPYRDEGEDELRAFKLAVKHLNGEGDGGMLETLRPLHLKGNGILGKEITYVIGDTQTNPEAAVAAAQKMIQEEKALMISGGSSSDVAISVQNLCQQNGTIFMVGLAHSNDVTGKGRRRYGFRHFFNAHMSGIALAPVLKEELGEQRRAFHLTADYTWGWTLENSIRQSTEALGWETAGTARTPVGTKDYSALIEQMKAAGADVLFLNLYGHDMVNALAQIVKTGLRDQLVNDKPFEIVAPLLSRLMAQEAGENIKGILGTANWNWDLQDEGSQTFVRSFAQEYGFPPSQAAHTCYCQTLLYANACEMAGTFYPPEVIKALEGFEFDGMGNGPTLYRAEDHQCFKNIMVVRGNLHPSSPFDLLEEVRQVPRANVTYKANLYEGDLGPYKV